MTNQLAQYARSDRPMMRMPSRSRSSRSSATLRTTTTTVMTNAKTKTRPKNTAANVDPWLVAYAGNGNALTDTDKRTFLSVVRDRMA